MSDTERVKSVCWRGSPDPLQRPRSTGCWEKVSTEPSRGRARLAVVHIDQVEETTLSKGRRAACAESTQGDDEGWGGVTREVISSQPSSPIDQSSRRLFERSMGAGAEHQPPLVRDFAGLVARIGAGVRRSRRSRFARPDDRLVPPRRLHLSVGPSAQKGRPPPLHCTCERACPDRPSANCPDGPDCETVNM